MFENNNIIYELVCPCDAVYIGQFRAYINIYVEQIHKAVIPSILEKRAHFHIFQKRHINLVLLEGDKTEDFVFLTNPYHKKLKTYLLLKKIKDILRGLFTTMST